MIQKSGHRFSEKIMLHEEASPHDDSKRSRRALDERVSKPDIEPPHALNRRLAQRNTVATDCPVYFFGQAFNPVSRGFER